jgi:ABC-type transporter Mla subunit MlaD
MDRHIKLFLTSVLALTFLGCFRNNKVLLVSNKADKLEVGSTVHKEGLTIGQVIKIATVYDKVFIEVSLRNNDIEVPHGSTFTIIPSPLGTAYISVSYSNSSRFISSNDTIVASYRDMGQLEDYISDTTKRKQVRQSLDKVAEGLSELVKATQDTLNAK